MRIKFLLLSFIFFISCSSFSSNFFMGRWYIEGEGLSLDFREDELVLREFGFGFVARAIRRVVSGGDVVYKLVLVSDNKFIKEKYPLGGDIVFRGLIGGSSERSNCLIRLPGRDFFRYYFSRSKGGNKVYYSDLLFSYEREDFLRGSDFLVLGSSYKVFSFTTLLDSLFVSGSDRFLLDGNYSTYFSVRGFSGILGNSLEFFFYDSVGKELSNDLRLRGIGFVLYPFLGVGGSIGGGGLGFGSLGRENRLKENILKDRDSFHRLKSLRLEFARGYGGGLSRSRGSYFGDEMDIVLEDRSGIQVLYFFKDIYTRGIRLRPMGIYPGYVNEFRLYELIFYINDLG